AILQSPAAYGEEVYIEVVDDSSQAAYAWIAADDFQIKSFADNLVFKYWETPINDDIISGGNKILSPLTLLPDLDWNLVRTHPAFGTGVRNFDLSDSLRLEKMFVQFEGYIDVPASGSYTFYLNSDDGSKLWINDSLIVNNDGVKSSPVEASGSTSLTAGKHLIKVGYFHQTGSPVLEVSWFGPSIPKEEIPESVLSTTGLSGTSHEFVSFMTIMPDDERIWNYCPTFMYDDVDGLYKIWSCGASGGDTILYKESTTLEGLRYAPTQPVLSPSHDDTKFDGTHACDPNVYSATNGDFYMTYSGWPTESTSLTFATRIGMAKSTDRGRTWIKLYGGNHIIEPVVNVSYGIGQSSVVRANDGYYYMIYTVQTNPIPGTIEVIRCSDPAFPTNLHEAVASLPASVNGIGHASLELAYDTFREQYNIIYGISDNIEVVEAPRTGIRMSYFDKNWEFIKKEELYIQTGFALTEGFALLQNLDMEAIQYIDRGVPTIVVAAATCEHSDNTSGFHANWVEGDTKYVTIPYDLGGRPDDNYGFEIGTLTNWATTGTAWNDSPD
ncbi:MAG: hypothetical protein KAG97_12645, partial [Victivallales bacterium]|nr:hypothetical protein [Victivallales bacterium]